MPSIHAFWPLGLFFEQSETFEETLNVDTTWSRGTLLLIIKDYQLSELQFLHMCLFTVSELHHKDLNRPTETSRNFRNTLVSDLETWSLMFIQPLAFDFAFCDPCCDAQKLSFVLTPLSSSSVEFLCLPLGFFTNSFSQEAWSSFSMLFPALITLEERRERPGGKVRMQVGWFIVFALTVWKHNQNQRDRERESKSKGRKKSRAGWSHVPEGACRRD